jgi:hypothetical protein
MESVNIFAEAIRKGSSSLQEEVKRDLASLLRSPKLSNPDSFVGEVEALLSGDTPALTWLDEIKVLSQSSPLPKFGHVLATEAGSAERLALGVRLRSSLETKSDAKDFVEESNTDLLNIFDIAKQIQDYLSDASGNTSSEQRLWVREFTPAFLQKILNDQSVSRELTVAATGGDLSTAWKEVESWVVGWANFRKKLPNKNPGGDGFFEPQHTNYQPAAIHPLALRILRKIFLNQLNAGGTQEIQEIQGFCQWLIDHVFDGVLLDAIRLESIFATGSLILALAHQQGVVIQEEDGKLDVPTTAIFWGDLSERVLKTIVNNSQQIDNVPSFWKDTQVEIRQLLYSCPEWYSAPLLSNLRARAAKLLEEELEVLKTVILRESLKLTEDKLKPEAELSSQSALPELRPEKPIDTIAPETADYFKKLDLLNSQIADISSFNSVIQKISTEATQGRNAFKQRLVSPLAEPALPVLVALSFEELNLPLATYLRQQVSQSSLDSKLVRSSNLIQETLANQPAWVNIINQTATTDEQVLSIWSKLDIWDGLRGRLTRSSNNEGDRNVTQYLSQQLPDWLQNDTIDPPTDLDLNAIRPTLAELAHLGVSLQLDTYQTLTNRLENLITRNALDDALKASLAAVRLELGLTALVVGVVPSQAFKQFESPSEAFFEQFAGWIKRSIESSNVWESRAGMNALILLARIAEGTGDLLFVNSAIKTAIPSGSRASHLVFLSVNQLLSTGSSKGSGLPLAFAAFDLARYAREATLSIAPQVTDGLAPVWTSQPIPSFIDRLTNQLGTATRTTLQKMVAEGGIGIKVLLLSLLQIKLDELDLERQLIVQPLRRNTSIQEAKLRHNVILKQIDDLQKAVRFVLCREQLLLVDTNALPEVSGEIKPWWQVYYWLASPSISQNGQLEPVGSVSSALGIDLEQLSIPSEVRTAGGLSGQAVVRSVLKGQRWLILDPQPDESNKTYLIEQAPDADNLRIYKAEAPFLLINWIASYHNNVEVSLLSLAASLLATIPMVSEDNPQDIDGRYEEEFPDLSWKETTDKLQKAIDNLKEVEDKYENALREQIDGNRANEIINLLKQPLLLNTADYQEQMLAAIAEVREAEADLEVAEFESLATQFEVLANQMLYEAADVEVQRQSVLGEVSKLDEQIAQLERDAEAIRERQVRGEIDIKARDVEIAKKVREKAIQESEKVKIARKAILQEIELLKKLLETPTPVEINGTQVTAKGQVGAMAYKVEATLIKQLNENLETAKTELKKAKDAEAERKKKEKRRKLIGGICRFVGAVIGTIYGGPAGAALGAEIGGAIGELANGVIENKAPEEILVGLIDNGFAIAQAAGVDLEKELNTLGAKGATQLNQFFDQLDSNLGPMLDSLPKILDEQLVKDAIVVLDLQEIPVLTQLLEKSYSDLRKDIPNLGQLGTTLKAIQYDSPRQFLDQLSDNLFKNTKNNVEGIQALSQAIGRKVEDLQTEEGRREAAERFAKLVVTRVGQEAANFRQDAIATWIRNKRDGQQWWNDVVQKEAENLVKELFPDAQSQAEVMANLESSLINPEIIRGELQVYLDPWQKELDRRIGEITDVGKNAPPPPSAVAAAEQSVKDLESCIEKFNKSLLPWLKGEGNTQRNQLLLDLNKLQTEKLPASDIDLKIAELDEANAQLSEANAKAALENMERELERVGKLYQATDLKVSKATLLNKVAGLAKLRAANLKGAQENSLKASEKRQQATQAKVKSAQFNLESKKALSQAAMQRGAESSRIRGSLSQPALQLPNLSANSTNRLRVSYTGLLKDASGAYRELLRFYKSAGATDIPVLDRNSKWSEALENWAGKAQTQFNTSIDQEDPQTVEWDLTPEQIAALLSPDGFRVVFAPQITEALPLFTVSRELESYLREGKLLNSPWKRAFAQVGINLSSEVSAELDGGGNWKIVDKQTALIRVTSYRRNGDPFYSWNIQSEAVTYTAISQGNTLTVTRRQEPPTAGRSPLPNQYWEQIAPEAATTGRLIGVFLDATIELTDQKLSESDYQIEVKHLGDFWFDRKQIKLLHTAKPLRRSRTFFLQKDVSPEKALENINTLSKSEGDPHPYAVQGTPLSGTTLIRLLPLGNRQFSKVKVRLLYKFYAPAG